MTARHVCFKVEGAGLTTEGEWHAGTRVRLETVLEDGQACPNCRTVCGSPNLPSGGP